MRKIIVPAILVLCVASVAHADSATTRPFPGLSYTHEIRKDPALHLHVITIDLTDPALHVVVAPAGADPDGEGPWETTLMTVREIAARDGLVAAVNGDFFMAKDSRDLNGKKFQWFEGNWARVCGLAMTDGRLWSGRLEASALVVDDKGKITIGQFNAPPPHAHEIIGGSTQILTNGRKTAAGDDRAPRTAAGVDAQGSTLTLLTIDGRRPSYSIGATLPELADELVRLGCHNAINLDGGGSATMVMREPGKESWQLLNRPSDGHDFPVVPLSVERPVANVLGIRIDQATTRRSGN